MGFNFLGSQFSEEWGEKSSGGQYLTEMFHTFIALW